MRWLALVGAIGCGRLGFGVAGDASDDARDGATDIAQGCGFDLCDNFETRTLAPVWTTSTMVSLDTTRAHGGAQAVHLQSAALAVGQSQYVELGEMQTLAVPATHFWVRGWFFLSALPAAGNAMELVAAEELSGGLGDYVVVRSTDTLLYTKFVAATKSAPAVIPSDTWFCIAFEVLRATNSTGSLALTSDVLPQTTLAPTQTDSQTAIQVIWFGVAFDGVNVTVPQPALDLWVDDVIVHSAPVTCAD